MRLAFTLFTIRNFKASASILFIAMTASSYGRKPSTISTPPVFWNIFNAEASDNRVVLKWTVTEYNNQKFYIQHSTNGNEWKTIDSVESKKSLESLEDYSFTHINTGEGRQYYRIKQVDIDIIKTGYSLVVSVMLKNNKQNITIGPNPATSDISITNKGNNNFYTVANIFDLTGKKVAEKKLQSHTNSVSVRELPAGAYIVRLKGTDGSIYNQKIIKQ